MEHLSIAAIAFVAGIIVGLFIRKNRTKNQSTAGGGGASDVNEEKNKNQNQTT